MEATGINMNTTAQEEQIPEIEQYIQTIKVRIRATINALPLDQLSHQLIVEMAYNTVFCVNCFPHKDGIHFKPTNNCHRVKNRI